MTKYTGLRSRSFALLVLALIGTPAIAAWNEIVGTGALSELFSDTTIEYSWAGRKAVVEYCADGTSTMQRNGVKSQGRWWVDTERRVCFQSSSDKLATCYTFHQHDIQKENFLARVIPTNGEVKFIIKNQGRPASCAG